jgi:WD40 repeat protein
MRARLIASVLTLLALAIPAFPQEDRRSLTTPELVVDSGGRLGSCDAIKFTSDGKYLLAVGDDKVVRVWPYVEPLPRSWLVPRWYQDGHLTTQGMEVLRWPSWREQRGAIFALALSPDKDNARIAIGGLGIRNGTVAVLDRKSKKILHLATPVPPEGEQVNSIWSMDFAPDGKRVAFGDSHGGVWLWNFTFPRGRLGWTWDFTPQRLGKHKSNREYNFVRFVHFSDNNTLVSVAEDGSVTEWTLGRNASVTARPGFEVPKSASIFRVAISPDGKWYAVAVQGGGKARVLLRRVNEKTPREIPLEKDQYARALAFDTKSERLAVSVASILRPNPPFYMEGPERVDFYDLKSLERSDGPRGLYRAWYIAFHPNGKDVAVAAGENHEVTLYNLAAPGKRVSVMEGAGRSIWEVALSQDGKQVGFRDQRDPAATNPNARALPGAPWRVFHLGKREWADATAFRAIKQNREWEGWSVAGIKDTKVGLNPRVWYVVTPQGERLPLPTDPDQDQYPFCWTFIPPEGKRKLQLAVGHLWGVSIFELTRGQEPKRVRLCTGHQAFVTSLAVSADGSWLVSGSMDQTLTAWSLKDWPSQRTLGASFDFKGKDLVVTQVDVGSPAWEAGLFAGDIVKAFHFAGGEKPYKDGDKTKWLEKLRDPKPGVEHRFDVIRDGKEVNKLATTARQRPLWRFFSTRENEWVLWMWQNSYYDSSTNGDSYVGWLVNAPDLDREPQFVPAERFREAYHRPGILDILVAENDVAQALRLALGPNPLPTRFDKDEPPIVALTLAADATKTDDVKATLTVVPQGGSVDFQPVRAELWINDFRLPLKDGKFAKWRQNGRALEYEVIIPNAKLRKGPNSLTFQVYNRVEGRAEAAKPLNCTRDENQEPTRRLYGLIVGINKYGKSRALIAPGKRGPLDDLNARRDAEALRESLLAQKKGLYQEIDLTLLADEQASRGDILAALDRLAQIVGPEDNCVIFLAGHGTFDARKDPKQEYTKWRFCCPNFDDAKPDETGISDKELQEKLAAIAGRKVVLLDACHSGLAAVANPVRPLVPSGQGPIVIAACDRQQRALENEQHGLFTAALLEALGPQFRQADTDGNQTLDARELFNFTRQELPNLLEKLGEPRYKQRPICFAPKDVKLYPLAAEKK